MSHITDKKVISKITSLKDEGGVIPPESVLAEARREDSVLHKYFEWDDGEAAEKYRLIQAQDLIRACVVYINDNPTQPVRAFVSLREDRVLGGGYRCMVDVMSDDQYMQKLLEDALFELHCFEEKYKRLTQLRPVFTAAKKLRAKLQKKE